MVGFGFWVCVIHIVSNSILIFPDKQIAVVLRNPNSVWVGVTEFVLTFIPVQKRPHLWDIQRSFYAYPESYTDSFGFWKWIHLRIIVIKSVCDSYDNGNTDSNAIRNSVVNTKWNTNTHSVSNALYNYNDNIDGHSDTISNHDNHNHTDRNTNPVSFWNSF